MKELYTEIEIKASPDVIWDVLTDFAAYPEWNPFLQSIEGDLVEGSKLKVDIAFDAKRSITLRPKILKVNKPHEFRWKGRLAIPYLFDGEHIFEVKQIAEGLSLFIQRECFSGILVPLFKNMIDTKTRENFECMNRAVKWRSETQKV